MAAILHHQLHMGGMVDDLTWEGEERCRTTLY
jgi:hypothetical protein